MLSYVDAEIVQPLEKAQITNSTMASDKKKKKKNSLTAESSHSISSHLKKLNNRRIEDRLVPILLIISIKHLIVHKIKK